MLNVWSSDITKEWLAESHIDIYIYMSSFKSHIDMSSLKSH